MRFVPAELDGVFVVEQERHVDDRGWFARTWDGAELAAHGLDPALVQCSASFNAARGTLRGMHYQDPPFAEAKLVRCTRGALFDVAVDLRPGSRSFLRWFGLELTPENGRALYIPRGFAHGFVTLSDATEGVYCISAPYSPPHARGVRWDDPAIAIAWPIPPLVISPADRARPALDRRALECLRGL
jgi:dTDP-4-dehydrorhamnose 3,5-epimerase